jgi:hypothetical protein
LILLLTFDGLLWITLIMVVLQTRTNAAGPKRITSARFECA